MKSEFDWGSVGEEKSEKTGQNIINENVGQTNPFYKNSEESKAEDFIT